VEKPSAWVRRLGEFWVLLGRVAAQAFAIPHCIPLLWISISGCGAGMGDRRIGKSRQHLHPLISDQPPCRHIALVLLPSYIASTFEVYERSIDALPIREWFAKLVLNFVS